MAELLGKAAIKCVSLVIVRGRHYGDERAIHWALPRISSFNFTLVIFGYFHKFWMTNYRYHYGKPSVNENGKKRIPTSFENINRYSSSVMLVNV